MAPTLAWLQAVPQDMPKARVVLSVLAEEAEFPGGISRGKLLGMGAFGCLPVACGK